jgi:putative photosynthetic complex assembly protein
MSDTERAKVEILPKKFLQFCLCIVLAVLFLVFFLKYIDYPRTGIPPQSIILEEKALKFVSLGRRNVSVFEGEKLVARSSFPNQGFLGVVYNAVERERIKKRISGKGLLRLVRYANGRLVLIDDSTELEIQLNSFGLKNAEVFGSLFIN